MRCYFSIILHRLRYCLRGNKERWAFCIGFIMCLFPSYQYIKFSSILNYDIQIMECFMLVFSYVPCFTKVFLGILLLVSDAPFVSNITSAEINRLGKRKWIKCQISYLFILCFFYLFCMTLILIIVALLSGRAYFSNQWSPAMQLLVRNDYVVIDQTRLAFPYASIVAESTPYQAMVMAFMLSYLYALCLGSVSIACNLLLYKKSGLFIAVILHMIGYIIYANGPFYFPQQASLLSCAIAALYAEKSYQIELQYTLLTFVGIIGCLLTSVYYRTPKIEVTI